MASFYKDLDILLVNNETQPIVPSGIIKPLTYMDF